jgi:hypothetical protein
MTEGADALVGALIRQVGELPGGPEPGGSRLARGRGRAGGFAAQGPAQPAGHRVRARGREGRGTARLGAVRARLPRARCARGGRCTASGPDPALRRTRHGRRSLAARGSLRGIRPGVRRRGAQGARRRERHAGVAERRRAPARRVPRRVGRAARGARALGTGVPGAAVRRRVRGRALVADEGAPPAARRQRVRRRAAAARRAVQRLPGPGRAEPPAARLSPGAGRMERRAPAAAARRHMEPA